MPTVSCQDLKDVHPLLLELYGLSLDLKGLETLPSYQLNDHKYHKCFGFSISAFYSSQTRCDAPRSYLHAWCFPPYPPSKILSTPGVFLSTFLLISYKYLYPSYTTKKSVNYTLLIKKTRRGCERTNE
nr:MAG TPA: hypothetical protein [Caudoviricetes sp.]